MSSPLSRLLVTVALCALLSIGYLSSPMLVDVWALTGEDGAPDGAPPFSGMSGENESWPYVPSSQTLVNGTETGGDCGSNWTAVRFSDDIRCNYQEVNKAPANQTGIVLLPDGTDVNGWSVTGKNNPCSGDATPWDELDDGADTHDGDATCREGSTNGNRVGVTLTNPSLIDPSDVDDFTVVSSAVIKKTASQAASISVDVKVGTSAYNNGATQATTTSYVRYSRTDNVNPISGQEWTASNVNNLVVAARCVDCSPDNRATQIQARVDAKYNDEYALEARFAWSNVPTTGISWRLVVECRRLNPGAENALIQVGQGGNPPASWVTAYTCSSDGDATYSSYLLSLSELNGGAPVVRVWDNQVDEPDDTVRGVLGLDVLRIDWTPVGSGSPPAPASPSFIGSNVTSPAPLVPPSFGTGNFSQNTTAPSEPMNGSVGPPVPDLVVAALTSSPEYAEYGEVVVLNVEVHNIGSEFVDNASLSLYDGFVGPAYLIGSANVTFVAFRANATVSWANPSPGDHSVIAVADDPPRIAESNESNNQALAVVGVAGIGATIPDISVDFPGSIEVDGRAVVNQTTSLTVAVRNVGSGTAFNFPVSVYDVSGPVEQPIGTFAVASLAPGSETNQTLTWVPAVPDIGAIRVVANANGSVSEKSSQNNDVITSFPIEIWPPPLYICDIWVNGDWIISSAQDYTLVTICVLEGSVHVVQGGSLGLHGARVHFVFNVAHSHLYGFYVDQGGTLHTDCGTPGGAAAAGPIIIDLSCARIFSDSSSYRYSFKANAGSTLSFGTGTYIGRDLGTNIDYLAGEGPRTSWPGGLEVNTPNVISDRLSIRWPEYHGLYIDHNVVVLQPLQHTSVIDAGSRGLGGSAIVLDDYSSIGLTSGTVTCGRGCSAGNGIFVSAGAILIATGTSVTGAGEYGVAVEGGTLSLSASSVIEGRLDAAGLGTGIGVYIHSSFGIEIRDSTIRKTMTGVYLSESNPGGGVIASVNTIDVAIGAAPYSGRKGIWAVGSTVAISGNTIGVNPASQVRRQASGIELKDTEGTVTDNTVYQATAAGIDVVDATSALTVSGGTVEDLTSTTDPLDSTLFSPCGVRVDGLSSNPIISDVTVIGGTWNWPQPIGICAVGGSNPTITGPGLTPGPHIEWVAVGIEVYQASAQVQGVRVERTVVGGDEHLFGVGICVVGNSAVATPVTIDGAYIWNGISYGVDVGACSANDDTVPAWMASRVTVENSHIGYDADYALSTPLSPGNEGIWVHQGSSADILGNVIRYFDIGQVRLAYTAASPPVQVLHNTLQDFDYSVTPPPDWGNRGLLLVYGAPSVIVSHNQFLGGIFGISVDPITTPMSTVVVDDRVGQNLFENQREASIGCGVAVGDCTMTVVNNEFRYDRGHAIIAAAGSWTIRGNYMHDNAGGPSLHGNPGVVYLRTAESVDFTGNRVIDSAPINGFGFGLGIRVEDPTAGVISSNLIQNNEIGVVLHSSGAYHVTNNMPDAACAATGLTDCGFRGNGVGIRVEGWAPRGPVSSNVVDGSHRVNSIGILFLQIDQQVTYDDTWANQVVNNDFGIAAFGIALTNPAQFRVRGLTSATVLSGNGYALYAYGEAGVEFGGTTPDAGNAISGNRWAVGVQQSPALVEWNTFTDQTEGGIWVGGRTTTGLVLVDRNTVSRSGPRTCSSPPAFSDAKGVYVTSYGDTVPNPFIRWNTILKVCFGVYTYNANAGGTIFEGVHDNTISDVAQGVTVDGGSPVFGGTYAGNNVGNVIEDTDWGFSVIGAAPIIQHHIGGTYGIRDFSKVGVYVYGSTAGPEIQDNLISTSQAIAGPAIPYGVYASGSVAGILISANIVEYLAPAPDGFEGIRLDHAVATVSWNVLSSPGPISPDNQGRGGILVCEAGTSECPTGTPPPSGQTVIDHNSITGFNTAIRLFGTLYAQVGPSNTVNVPLGAYYGIGVKGVSPVIVLVVNNDVIGAFRSNEGIDINVGTVQENRIYGFWTGIGIRTTLAGPLIFDKNHIHDNSIGITANDGAPSAFTLKCSDIYSNGIAVHLNLQTHEASIYRNNIHDNGGFDPQRPGNQAQDFGGGNYWDDDQSVGNYWGTSTPPHPVTIPDLGSDRFPQTGPISCP